MIFVCKIIKNRFLNILILFGLTFNVANLNAFSVNSLIDGPKSVFKNFVENVKADPATFVFVTTVITAIVAASVGFIISEVNNSQAKKDSYDKKLKETCVVCDKENKECLCVLLYKIKCVFNKHGFVETREYLNGNYSHRYCNWLTKKIKSVILKINDINMKFNYKDGSETILHIACDYGHEPIVRWLVEEMFVDINAVNIKGISASDMLKNAKAFCESKVGIINETSTSTYDFFSKIDGCLLDKKLELQSELLDCVKSLKSLLLDNRSQEALNLISSDAQLKLGNIIKLIESKRTPGFAKQLVMSDLIFIYKNFKEFISYKKLADFYKHIAFNYTFLTDSRFASALEFAESQDGKNIIDIDGRSVAQAREIYKQENKDIRCDRAEDFIESGYYYSSRF